MGTMYRASLDGRIRDMRQSLKRLQGSLASLAHPGSVYGDDHRLLIKVYKEALALFENAQEPEAPVVE